MTQRLIGVLVLFLLVGPLLVVADDCGFFCKMNNFFRGDPERRAVVGK